MFVTVLLAATLVLGPGVDRTRRMQHPALDQQQFYAAVHAELRAGATVRQSCAAATAGHAHPALRRIHRVSGAGSSLPELAEALRAIPGSGSQAAAAVTVAAHAGGKSADVFLRLADRAAADADVERQRQVLTTQSRFSALIVGGLPVAWFGFGGLGRLTGLIEAGGAPVALVGLAMELVGVGLVWRLASV